MSQVGIITQARTTSTRLPRKVLTRVGGKSLLEHHLERLVASGLEVHVATTTNQTDDEVAAITSGMGLQVHRGSETDVLSRFHDCAALNDLDVIVRVTSDCPLVDGALIARAVEQYVETGDPWLYLSNTLERTFPRGFDFEIFSSDALNDANTHATVALEREHVTPYLYAQGNRRMHLRNISWSENKSHYRVTVDTPDDLALIRALIEDHAAASMSCGEIITVLDRHPELVALNRHVGQKKLGE